MITYNYNVISYAFINALFLSLVIFQNCNIPQPNCKHDKEIRQAYTEIFYWTFHHYFFHRIFCDDDAEFVEIYRRFGWKRTRFYYNRTVCLVRQRIAVNACNANRHIDFIHNDFWKFE